MQSVVYFNGSANEKFQTARNMPKMCSLWAKRKIQLIEQKGKWKRQIFDLNINLNNVNIGTHRVATCRCRCIFLNLSIYRRRRDAKKEQPRTITMHNMFNHIGGILQCMLRGWLVDFRISISGNCSETQINGSDTFKPMNRNFKQYWCFTGDELMIWVKPHTLYVCAKCGCFSETARKEISARFEQAVYCIVSLSEEGACIQNEIFRVMKIQL